LQPESEAGGEHATEIRLSAFLRLLNSRDVYRRVYQMRIEPAPLLDLLWKNRVAPRSVVRCLQGCSLRIQGSEDTASPATARAMTTIEAIVQSVLATDWESILRADRGDASRRSPLQKQCSGLLERILGIHDLISDGFLNHQIHMRHETQPLFPGLKNAL
jgi:uncharacterized alpha-E superfamily protein